MIAQLFESGWMRAVAWVVVAVLVFVLAELRARRRHREQMEWLKDRAAQRGILL